MKKHSIEFTAKIELSDEDINDLMVCALEGGINYWCRSATAKLVPDGVEYDYLSDLISKGGVIELHNDETDEKHDLNLSKFLNGVKWICEKRGFNSGEQLMDNHDAEVADCIVQYGLFGEIVFG